MGAGALKVSVAMDESTLQQIHTEVSVVMYKAMLERLKVSAAMNKSMPQQVYP